MSKDKTKIDESLLDIEEKNYLKDLSNYDSRINFIETLLDEEGAIQFNLQKLEIKFDRENFKYATKLKSRGLMLESNIDAPDIEEFDGFISDFLTMLMNKLKEGRNSVNESLEKYRHNKEEELFDKEKDNPPTPKKIDQDDELE